jgi:hypothetical protein
MINLLYPKMKSKFTTILLIATSLAYGAEPLPKEAVDLLMKRQEAISRIDETLVAELEKVKLASMKKGDLAAANAVDLLIKEQAGDSRLIGGNTPASKGGSTLPIRFRAGMKLLWSPDAHKSAYFILEKRGKIRSLDDKAWQGSTADWKWESKAAGKITLTFTAGTTTLTQRKDSLMLEGSDPSKKGTKARLTVVGF